MRIIGGIYKGRKLAEFKGGDVRPTSDFARESLFNILRNHVEGSCFLDAFSGTGAVGIEALSRGAKIVSFNDLSKESINIIKQNLLKISSPANTKVSLGDALYLMKKSANEFDIIFLDPPYNAQITKEALVCAEIALKKGGIVVLEDEKHFQGEVSGLKFYDKRKYGRAHFSFFKKEEE